MRLRRLAFGGFAVATFAAAGLVPAAANGEASGAAPAKTICVGLVVDARSIGDSVSAKCVTVRRGTTGVGVLEAAGDTVTFRDDGLLCTIDGLPKTGCNGVDDTHYWAYYHRAPGHATWSYSDEGPSTYQPVNRSTEGWVYDDGSPLTPENIPAAKICAALVKPAASTTPTLRATSPSASRGSAPSPPASQSKSATTGAARRHRSPPATPSALTPTAPLPTSSSSPIRVLVSTRSAPVHGNATGALIAAGLIAVLAAAGAIAARRRRRT